MAIEIIEKHGAQCAFPTTTIHFADDQQCKEYFSIHRQDLRSAHRYAQCIVSTLFDRMRPLPCKTRPGLMNRSPEISVFHRLGDAYPGLLPEPCR